MTSDFAKPILTKLCAKPNQLRRLLLGARLTTHFATCCGSSPCTFTRSTGSAFCFGLSLSSLVKSIGAFVAAHWPDDPSAFA